MKAAMVKKPLVSLTELQEAFRVLYDELCAELVRMQANMRKLQQACPNTEAYDQGWADMHVSLNVIETKAHILQEILDQISERLEDKAN